MGKGRREGGRLAEGKGEREKEREGGKKEWRGGSERLFIKGKFGTTFPNR